MVWISPYISDLMVVSLKNGLGRKERGPVPSGKD